MLYYKKVFEGWEGRRLKVLINDPPPSRCNHTTLSTSTLFTTSKSENYFVTGKWRDKSSSQSASSILEEALHALTLLRLGFALGDLFSPILYYLFHMLQYSTSSSLNNLCGYSSIYTIHIFEDLTQKRGWLLYLQPCDDTAGEKNYFQWMYYIRLD